MGGSRLGEVENGDGLDVKRSLLKTTAAYALGTLLFGAGPAHAQSLESELSLLLRDHPQIEAARKGVNSAVEGTGVTKGAFFPKVALTGAYGYENVDSPARRSTNQEAWGGAQKASGFTVTQNLFDGFGRMSKHRAASLTKEASDISLDNVTQNVLLEGITAYITVLKTHRLVELARDNEENIRRQTQLEDERVQRGSGITVDVLQSKSRLQTAKERRVTMEGQRADAISKYVQVFNKSPEVGGMADPQPPVDQMPVDLDAAIKIALAENPSISNSEIAIKVADEKRKIAQAEYYPNLDVVAAGNFEEDKNTVSNVRKDYSLLLKATWELYNGLSTTSAAAQAAFDREAAKDTMAYTQRKVIEQVKVAWQALLTARERLSLLENAVSLSTEVFDSRRKLREQGKATLLEVLDAENDTYSTRINYTSASYDARQAAFQLLVAMGRMDVKTLNVAR